MNFPQAVLVIAWIGAAAGPVLAWLLWRRWPGRATAALLATGGAAYACCVWGFLVEPRLLKVRRLTVESAAWTGPPVRIGVLSDTHVGTAYGSPERVRQAVATLNRERPDLIVLLGDYAGSHEPAEARSAPDRSAVLRGVAALAEARAALGRIAVLGNHDWWYDGPAIEAALGRAGIPVLENRAVRVARPGGAFWVAGLADQDSRRQYPAPRQALGPVPSDEPVIVLTHWPDPFSQIPPGVALTLAGHSHCGQVRLPLVGRPISASPGAARWPCGLYDEGGRKLFVTGGLGVSILPVRFGAAPEVAVVTLTATSAP